jgi:dTDP-4-dehydrorhamnose 3,5-epimerase
MRDVIYTPLRRIVTAKGDVLHGLKASDPGFAGFGEAYFSHVLTGAVKGWRRHRIMTMNLIVCAGSIRFVLYDMRPDSETCGCFAEFRLSPESPESYGRLTVPAGVWMAFQGIASGPNILLDIASIEHDPAEGESVAVGTFPVDWGGLE